MTFIAKSAGILSVVSCVNDIHKTALLSANREYQKSSANFTIAASVGAQKANKISYKDAARKNWLARRCFGQGVVETFAKVKGYLKGFAQGTFRYLPKFALSAVAIFTGKHKHVANLAAMGLAIAEAFDFITNSTNMFQKTDYLKK